MKPLSRQDCADYYLEFMTDTSVKECHKEEMHQALLKCIEKMEMIYNYPVGIEEIRAILDKSKTA